MSINFGVCVCVHVYVSMPPLFGSEGLLHPGRATGRRRDTRNQQKEHHSSHISPGHAPRGIRDIALLCVYVCGCMYVQQQGL